MMSTSQMTPANQELQALVGRALVDPAFQEDLLNGHRSECLAQFGLTEEELSIASCIAADDLTSFAAQLDTWIRTQRARMSRRTPLLVAANSYSMPTAA
jgi:hypothetical protein